MTPEIRLRDPLPSLSELLTWPEGQAPYAKQEEAHQLSSAEKLFALWMEQRTGKCIISLGTAAYQYRRLLDNGGNPTDVPPRFPYRFHNEAGFDLSRLPKNPAGEFIYRPDSWAKKGLDGLLVIAMPSGVPLNWKAEADLRLPPWANAKTFVWSAARASTQYFAKDFLAFVSHPGLVCFFVNGEAIQTPLCRKAIGLFLRTRRALVIGDETSLVCATPGNVRSRTMDSIRKLPGAIARRVLDGTPGDESPLDYWQQCAFLDPKLLGFPKWSAYRKFICVFEDKEVWIKNKVTKVPEKNVFPVHATDPDTGAKLYQNLPIVAESMSAFSFRVKRTDVFKVHDKVYAPHRFELSAKQREVYDPLSSEFEAYIGEKRVTATHVLARLTRLDQICSNFWPPEAIPQICGACQGDGCEACDDVGAIIGKTKKLIIDPNSNPRLEALEEVLSMNPEPAILWCLFNETVDAVLELGDRLGRKPVRYDGKVGPEEKAVNFQLFKSGLAGLLVSKEASAGRGLDGRAARWMCYVEGSYSGRKRSQSEDRAEVAGRDAGTGIVDLLAVDTQDDRKYAARRAKRDAAEWFMTRLRRAA